MEFKKVFTENPFIDEIVYNTKILTYDTVLKDEDEALNNETLESLKESTMYVACKTNTETFDILEFTKDDLKLGINPITGEYGLALSEVPTDAYPEGQLQACLDNKYNIPLSMRARAIAIAKKRILATYVEKNEYYRMLNGQPPLKSRPVYVDKSYITDDSIIIDIDKPIHELSDSEINVLDELGVIDKLVDEYPDYKFLRHLGGRKIDIVTARKANKFDILYVPSIDFEDLRQRFIDRLVQTRAYTLRCVYSEAFKLGSEKYYDKFLMLFIVLQAAIDLLSETQVFIAKRDVFDVRSIQYIFSSYGIPYYQEIPVKYQINMMKNLNKLIKYKATSINMVDICSLFGFPNVTIFKYYILKDRKINPDGTFVFNENEEDNYDLKFLRVPIDKNFDDFIKEQNNYINYESLTTNDWLWDEHGELADKVRKDLIAKEFNIMRSKYISIDATYEMTEVSFELPYFFNMLYDDVKLEDQLKLSVPYISNTAVFRFTDVFIMIFALGYFYNGLKDKILNAGRIYQKETIVNPDGTITTKTVKDAHGNPVKRILHIMGFNFKQNMMALGEYIMNKGYTAEDLGVADFIVPTSSILTYNQLLEIFTSNKNVHNKLTELMMNADDKDIFDIYKQLYDALMITEFTNDYFKTPDGEIAETYTEFMYYRDAVLYNVLKDMWKEVENSPYDDNGNIDLTNARRKIDAYIESIVTAIQEYIDSDKYKYLFSNIPGETADYLQKYIMKIINFFKSYKIDMVGTNTIYTIDDKFDNLVRAIDKIHHTDIMFYKDEFIDPLEKFSNRVSMMYPDKVCPVDDMYISYVSTIIKTLFDNIREESRIMDKMHVNNLFYKEETIPIEDKIVQIDIYRDRA